MGLATATLCINRRLALISSVKQSAVSRSDRRKALAADLSITIVPPVLIMVIHYTVQANRFNIFAGTGCIFSTYVETYAILGLFVPPLIAGLCSFVFGGQSLSTGSGFCCGR